MISDEIGLTIMNDCDFDDYVSGSPHDMTNSCNEAITEANKIVGDYINDYDVILDVCYPAIVEQELRLRKVVHIMFFYLPYLYPITSMLFCYLIFATFNDSCKYRQQR